MELVKNTTNRGGGRGRALSGPERCWKWFSSFFPRGFRDAKYIDWERSYKLRAHEEWQEVLNQRAFRKMLKEGRHNDLAATAVKIESRTNLLFSFEKMALRDAVRSSNGARIFAQGLYDVVHGRGRMSARFDRWCDAVRSLPRKQTRVLTHPVVTVFPFIADPVNHIFLKPNVTKDAAARYGIQTVVGSLFTAAEICRNDQLGF